TSTGLVCAYSGSARKAPVRPAARALRAVRRMMVFLEGAGAGASGGGDDRRVGGEEVLVAGLPGQAYGVAGRGAQVARHAHGHAAVAADAAHHDGVGAE